MSIFKIKCPFRTQEVLLSSPERQRRKTGSSCEPCLLLTGLAWMLGLHICIKKKKITQKSTEGFSWWKRCFQSEAAQYSCNKDPFSALLLCFYTSIAHKTSTSGYNLKFKVQWVTFVPWTVNSRKSKPLVEGPAASDASYFVCTIGICFTLSLR